MLLGKNILPIWFTSVKNKVFFTAYLYSMGIVDTVDSATIIFSYAYYMIFLKQYFVFQIVTQSFPVQSCFSLDAIFKI